MLKDGTNDFLIPFNNQNDNGINPLLRKNFSRLISIDSFFRHNSIPSLQNIPYSSLINDYTSVYSTTNFVATLSEPVTFVTKLTLETVRIPNTFYNIDSSYGNNVFAFRFTDDVDPIFKIIEITPGKYTISTFVSRLIDIFKNIYPTLDFDDPSNNIEYDTITGKLSFSFINTFEIVFYDNNFTKYYTDNSINIPNILPRLNYNLGWILGFRDPLYTNITHLTSEACVDLSGPRHFIIVLDDFNHNHLNKAIISVENRRNKPSLPNYTTDNLNIENRDGVSTYDQIINNNENIDDFPINGQYPFYTRQDTKKLTQAQLYSLNEIIKERQKRTNLIIDSPTENNVFAIIPNIRQNDNNFDNHIILTSNMLRENVRHYFGRVDIERVAVQLYDDKGNLINLNGANWSFTVKAL